MKKNRKFRKFWGWVAAVPLLIAILACSLVTQTGETIRESEAIPLEGMETVTVDVRMGAGEMAISGGASDLMNAEFIYNVEDWKPIIDYASSGNEGTLIIEQPDVKNFGLDTYRYEWELQFNEGVIFTSLDIDLGAGKSIIDLSKLAVSEVVLAIGAGEVELDLTGSREIDLTGTIRGGVGKLTVYLPEDIGVLVNIDGGIGSVNTGGLNQTADGYVNDAYGTSATTITLDIEGGVGEIELLEGN